MSTVIEKYEEWVDASNWAASEDENLTYSMLALCGEAGEMADSYKKKLRGDYEKGKRKDQDFRRDMLLEAGDVLHYLVRVLHCLNSNLEEIANMNVEKIEERKKTWDKAS